MEVKKVKKLLASELRVILFLVGYCLTMGTVFGVLNYKQYEVVETKDDTETFEDDEANVEQTFQEPPPPPPKLQPPVIEIVEDDVDIKDPIELKDTEDDDNEEIGDLEDFGDDDGDDGGDDLDNQVLDFFEVSKKAEFKKGARARMQFIADNLEYPQEAIDEGIEGRVTVSFIVEKNGTVTNVKVMGSRKLGFGLEAAAIKVVKKMNGQWAAAEQRDKKVRMRFRQPIRFKLQ